ncbi:MAG: ABC transporter ATP-binding protein [Kiloniellales bacterium]
MASIRFEHVWKRYGEVEAVKDLNLSCADGEFLALLGPSGCGKTSSLRMLAGLETISDGDILIGERRINDIAPKDRDIAMVFEDYALYPHLSVFDNIAFPLKIRKVARADIQGRVAHVIALLGLEALRDDNVQRLSGGAQQRVSIGRAIVRDPQVLLMDEPISHLDAAHKVELRGELKRLQRSLGVSTVYVTHDQIEAMALADRLAVMNNGVLQQLGPPRQLYDHPANLFVAGFIGEPPMNFLSCRLDASEGCLRGQGFRLPLGPDFVRRLAPGGGDDLVLGVRPAHLKLCAPEAADGLAGEVFAIEPRGDSAVIAVDLGGRRLLVEAEPRHGAKPGDQVGLEVAEEGLHLFDARSEENLLQAI